MDIVVLNQNYQRIHIFDSYESIVWADRYFEHCEFEIYTALSQNVLEYLAVGNYLQQSNSEHTMIIEDFTITSDVEAGEKIKIIGRGVESILDRRIVWTQTNITGNLQNGVKKLLTDSIINPSISSRRISNFVFKDSNDPKITALKMDNQYTGDDLLSIIESLCRKNRIGFKVTLSEEGQFVFELYSGVDRSYAQNSLPYVVFKPSFENIIDSNYLETHSTEKNVALVAGEGEGVQRTTVTVGSGSGLNRKELYVDARDVRSEDAGSAANYTAALKERGLNKLAENVAKQEFDGKCETTRMYQFGRDFFMGDTVQIANEYGQEAASMVTEFAWSQNASGMEAYPTFTSIRELEEEEES